MDGGIHISPTPQVVSDASSEVPPPDMIAEGGLDPAQRRCAFLELALCTASGLDDAGLATLMKVRALLHRCDDATLCEIYSIPDPYSMV